MLWFPPLLSLLVLKARPHARHVIVDVENVRGKSGFVLNHQQTLRALNVWHSQWNVSCTAVIDHGSEPSRILYQNMLVQFAGTTRKADDVIADDLVRYCRDDVVVVTADTGLIDRCRRNAHKKQLSILPPLLLVQDLETILEELPEETKEEQEEEETEEEDTADSLLEDETTQLLDYEIKLGAELLQAEAYLNMRSGINNKRKKKLQQRVRKLREKLPSSVLTRVTALLSNQRGALVGLDTDQQNALLKKWEAVRRTTHRKEKTGDRVLLAENLRRQLLEKYKENRTAVPSFLQPDPLEERNRLRLVLVSDTHGFEKDLTELPAGDVLMHLGDFCSDTRPRQAALLDFDAWMAAQPHASKVILRGNHDVRAWIPSDAEYITRPCVKRIGAFDFAMVPYGSLSNRVLPRRCDVLASHVPPKGLLDECLTGHGAGSAPIRRQVERMKAAPPVLWACGHIHEARGMVRHQFCAARETLVVNAANANAGMAERIAHSPVVVDLIRESKSKIRVDVVDMEHQYSFLNQKHTAFFDDLESDEDVSNLLLAVDLGLKTGFALFNDEGHLLRYENHDFETMSDLRDASKELMVEWPKQVGDQCTLSHVAIEGADVKLRQLWKDMTIDKAILSVKPEEWRRDLLLEKEKDSGSTAKEAARLVARQVIADFGQQPHEGKLNTDVAEAILLGYHVSRRLGWIQQEPAVKRYSNGAVIVPKAVEVV